MATRTNLPGVEDAREILGMTYDEIAAAVHTNPSTLYRWREGENAPNDIGREQLTRLEELVRELRAALEPEGLTSYWLNAPASIFSGRTPREMICAGRAETVLGALLSQQWVFHTLEDADRGGGRFAELMARKDISIAGKAALALLDDQIDELVHEVRSDTNSTRIAKAFSKPPRVKITRRASSGAT